MASHETITSPVLGPLQTVMLVTGATLSCWARTTPERISPPIAMAATSSMKMTAGASSRFVAGDTGNPLADAGLGNLPQRPSPGANAARRHENAYSSGTNAPGLRCGGGDLGRCGKDRVASRSGGVKCLAYMFGATPRLSHMKLQTRHSGGSRSPYTARRLVPATTLTI